MSESRFNAIIILDAVPEGEPNTARRLKEDLRDIERDIADGLQVRYYRLDNIENLRKCILSTLNEMESNGLKPWIHLDGHGLKDQSGFVFANKKTFCSWRQLIEIITPINVESNLNLMMLLATCFGGSFARAIETTDCAPVLGIIGPRREVTPDEVQRAFTGFYQTFFNTRSLGEALSALYKLTFCTKEAAEKRASRLYQQQKKKGGQLISVGQIKRTIKARDPEVFNNFRDTYFMYDLDIENRKRFPVTHKRAEINAKEFANQALKYDG